MKIFEDLLDSYQKIKKRKFKPTLEEAKIRGIQIDDESLPDLLQGGLDYVKSNFGELPPESMQAGVPIKGKDNKTYTLYSDDRGVHVKDGRFGAGRHLFDPQGNFIQDSPKTHKDLVGAFSDLEVKKKARDYATEDLETLPEEEFMQLPGVEEMSPLMMSPYADQKSVINFQKIRSSAYKKLWSALPEKFRSTGAWGASEKEFASYLVGGRHGSLENQLANAVSLARDDRGLFIEGAATTPNKHMVRHISDNLVNFIDLASKANLSHSEKELVGSYFGVDNKGRVCLFRDTFDEGLVVEDKNGFLKNIIHFMKERHNIDFYQVRYPDQNTGTDNQLRGILLEGSNIFLNLLNQSKILNSPAHAELANLVYEKVFKDRLLDFARSNYDWVYKASNNEAAVSLEDVPYYDELVKFFNRITLNLNSYLRGFISAHSQVLNRNPDFMVRAGHLTGIGKKADLIEGYNSYESALEAAQKLGLPEEAIIPRTPEELLEIDPELVSEYAARGLLQPQVFTINVSQKSLINNTNKVSLGAIRSGRVDQFLNNELQGLDAEQVRFRAELASRLKLTPLHESQIKSVAAELQKRRNALDLPTEAMVQNSEGKNILTTPALDFLVNYRREFLRSHSMTDIKRDSLKRSIFNALNNIEKKVEEYPDTPARVLELIGRYHEIQYLGANIHRPEVRKYIASKIYAIGGSGTPTSLEVKTLTNLESKSIDSNKMLVHFLKQFMADEKSQTFDFTISPSGFSIKRKTDKSQYLHLSYFKVQQQRIPTTTTRLYASNSLLQYYSMNLPSIQESKVILTELKSLLNSIML